MLKIEKVIYWILEKQLGEIGNRLKVVLEKSIKNNESTELVAKDIAWERIKRSS